VAKGDLFDVRSADVADPGLDASWGFPVVVASMVVVGGVLALFFRRPGW